MAEKIEVGVVIKGADKASQDMSKVTDGAKDLGSSMEGADKMVSLLEGGLDKMTNGAYSGFKKGAMGIKTFVMGLKATKTAIIATGIGALVVAFGLLVAYWDDIKEAVTGVSAEQEKLLINSRETTAAAQAEYDITLQTEATLKLRGATEKEILEDKRSQAQAVVDATKKEIELAIIRHKSQNEAAVQNQKILAGVIAFMQAPVTFLLGSVDALTYGLEKLGIIEKATTFAKDAALWTASFIVDPEKIKAEGDAALAELENQLRNQENTVANFTLQQESAAKKEKELKDASDAEKLTAEEALALELARLRAENLTDAEAKALALLELERETTRQELKEKGARQELLDAMDANFDARKKEIEQTFADERAAANQVLTDYLMSKEELELAAFDKKADALRLANIAAKGDEVALEEKFRIDRKAITDRFDAAEKAAAKATAQAVRTARLGVVAAGFDALKSMAKTEEQSKKLAIAQILVNQGIALSSAIAGAQASATGTGPLAVFTAPGFTLSMIAMVLSSFAQIKGIMNQAGAATAGLDLSTPSLGGGGGGGGGSSSGGGGNQLAMTPDMAASFGEGVEIPPVQAYIVQNDISDAGALATELQLQASL